MQSFHFTYGIDENSPDRLHNRRRYLYGMAHLLELIRTPHFQAERRPHRDTGGLRVVMANESQWLTKTIDAIDLRMD